MFERIVLFLLLVASSEATTCVEGEMQIYDYRGGGWIPLRCPQSCTGCYGVKIHAVNNGVCTDRCISPQMLLEDDHSECGECPTTDSGYDAQGTTAGSTTEVSETENTGTDAANDAQETTAGSTTGGASESETEITGGYEATGTDTGNDAPGRTSGSTTGTSGNETGSIGGDEATDTVDMPDTTGNGVATSGNSKCVEGDMTIYDAHAGGWVPLRCPRSCTGCFGVKAHSTYNGVCTGQCVSPGILQQNDFLQCGDCPTSSGTGDDTQEVTGGTNTGNVETPNTVGVPTLGPTEGDGPETNTGDVNAVPTLGPTKGGDPETNTGGVPTWGPTEGGDPETTGGQGRCVEGDMQVFDGLAGGWIPIRCPRSCKGCYGVKIHTVNQVGLCSERCILPQALIEDDHSQCGGCPSDTVANAASAGSVRGSNEASVTAKEDVSGASRSTLVLVVSLLVMVFV